MTNLGDYLNDFAEDIHTVDPTVPERIWEERKWQLIYEYLKVIKKKLIGGKKS